MKLIVFTKLFLMFFFVYNAKGGSLPFFLFPKLCYTDQCRELGLNIYNSLNTSTHPCRNFYEYTCSVWAFQNRKPPSEIVWNHFHSLANRINGRVQAILEDDDDPSSSSLQKARKAYGACLGKRTYLRELRLLIDRLGGWPLAMEFWNETGHNWLMQVAKVTRILGVHPVVKMHVNVDMQDTSRHVVYIDPGTFVMPRNVLIHPENYAFLLLKYKRWILETAKYIYPNKLFAHSNEDVHQIIDLEIQLAKLTLLKHKRTKISVMELSAASNIEWKAVLAVLFNRTEVNATSYEYVLYSSNYMQYSVLLINMLKPRIIANYIIWTVIKSLSRDSSKYMRKLSFIMDNSILGVQSDLPRTQECVSKINEHLSWAVIPKYVQVYLKPGVLREVHRMAQNIKTEHVKMLQKNNWLNSEIRKLSVEKVLAAKFLIGFPEQMKNGSSVDGVYGDVNISRNHFVNVLNLKQFAVRRELNELIAPVNNIRWPNSPLEVNAFYSVLQNSIIIPLGMLEAPFFDTERPTVLNYGALGSLIGHEISHMLDTTGRQADKYGNVRQWWSREDISTYDSKLECFEKQYAKYGVDGSYTLGENIADNVGMLMSYRAFRNQKSLVVIPHLDNFTTEQLFFISYAQLWCEASDVSNYLQEEEHSPVQVRVRGTTSNSNEFLTSFNCPKNSIHKCDLW